MSKSNRAGARDSGRAASGFANKWLGFLVLSVVGFACGQHDESPSAQIATGSASAPAASEAPALPNATPLAISSSAPIQRRATEEDIAEASRAYLANRSSTLASGPAGALLAQAAAARFPAKTGAQTPAFGGPTRVLDLGGPTVTAYPLSADGKYYKVNLVRRNYPPPTASATFTAGAAQIGQAAPPAVLDGRDSAFTWNPAVAGDPNASSTLTVDLGQYFLVGAVRPLYQPLGTNQLPAGQRIRLATKLGPNADWQEVFNGSPASPDSTVSFAGKPARFLELKMTGLGSNLLELFVYPSAATSPPPTSADGYDLGSLAAAASTVNDNYLQPGVAWPQSWPQGAFSPKLASSGPTGDAVGTVDLGREYPVSRLSLGFFWSTPWINGGRVELGTAANVFSTLYDSGAGQIFNGLNDFAFAAQPVRYLRATDYFVGNQPSPSVLWSVLSFTTPPPRAGFFPLSADGQYFVVNLAHRPAADPQPTASVVYANGAVAFAALPSMQAPDNLLDGDDTAFVWQTPGAAPDATATVTIDLGQVRLLGAVRPMYGSALPVSSTIRVAESLSGPWSTVADAPVTDPNASFSFSPQFARYVELTMKGTTAVGMAVIFEVQIFPSSATEPAPSSASHLDLTYLTGMSVTTNASMGQAGAPRYHSVENVTGFYVKTAAQGATGDGTLTIDLGQQYSVSELDLNFYSNQTWPVGGKLETDDGSGTWFTVFDSGRGTPLATPAGGSQRISFTPRVARSLRLTGYFDPAAAQGLLEGIAVFGDTAQCIPNCAGKVCGASASNGCGGTCGPLCGNGDVGCVTNTDCQSGLSCSGQSPGASSPNTCQPSVPGQCSNASLSANPATSASSGALVTLTSTAACGAATPQYRFGYGPSADTTIFNQISDWGSSNVATWNTSGVASGSYTLYAYVRAVGNTGFDTLAYGTMLVGSTCGASALSVSPSSPYPNLGQPPAAVGQAVTLTASAICSGSGTVPEYQYYYMPPGTAASYVRVGCPGGQTDCPNTWTLGNVNLDTTNFPSGSYGFYVRTRAYGNQSSQESSAYAPGGFLLGQVCTSTTLLTTPQSPQLSGTPIALNATAICIGGTAEHHYAYRNINTEYTWHDVAPGYTASQVSWDSTGLPGGSYEVQVFTRRAGNTSASEAFAVKAFSFDVLTAITTDAPTVEDFNGLGVNASAELPSGWRIDAQSTPRTVGTFAAAPGKTEMAAGAGFLNTATNGTYNFGAGVSDVQAPNFWGNSSDRAPGWLSAGDTLATGGTKSGNLYVALRAPVDKDLTSLSVSYDVEKYNAGSNSSGFRIQLYSSTDGTSWISAGENFLTNVARDENDAVSDPAPGTTIPVPPRRLDANIPRGSTFYLAWNYTINSASSVDASLSQGLAIDNVTIRGTAVMLGGVGCQVDSDCESGACAGKSPGATSPDMCVPTLCLSNPVSGGCGFSGAPCGSTCATKPLCNTTQDCASGYVCGNGNGARYGAPGANVCERPACQTSPEQVGCGTVSSECGLCACTPSCEGKTCGNSGDGCGSSCPGVCADRVAGCSIDSDCTAGSACVAGGGPRVGLAVGTNVCLPTVCRSPISSSVPCGTLNSECGLCPVAPASVCDGLECGADPTYGVACGSACQGGNTCVANQCVPPRFGGSTVIDALLGPSPGIQFSLAAQPFVQSATVGALSGNFEVTDRGAAHYSIPITVPPGRAGLQPNLSLDYISTKENGYVGVGWSLSGLSAISTCPRTVSIDGEARSVKDDGADPYCLDGQRLIEVPGSPGEYRTEIDSFSKVYAYTTQDSGSPTAGPETPRYPKAGFIVSTKEGRIVTYSPTVWHSLFSGGAVVRSWNVTELDDRNGNSVRVRYQQFRGALCAPEESCDIVESAPISIEYGRNSRLGNEPISEVHFHYTEGRPDKLLGYSSNGLIIQRSRLLDHVRTLVDGVQVRDYSLHYEQSPRTGQERLTGIQECASRGGPVESCKSPTSFTYQNPSLTSTPGNWTYVNNGPRVAAVLDWNGDGADDIVYSDLSLGISDRRGGFLTLPPRVDLSSKYKPDRIEKGSAFDFDQDGDDDLFDFAERVSPVHGWVGTKENPVATYYVYLSNAIEPAGPGSTPPVKIVEVPLARVSFDGVPFGTPAQLGTAKRMKLVDVDGDGLKDLLACTSLGIEGDVAALGYYSGAPGGGFASRSELPPSPGLRVTSCDAPAQSFDVDGDGTPELVFGNQVLHIRKNSVSWTTMTTTIGSQLQNQGASQLIFADLNGDGLKDLVSGASDTRVNLNLGGTFGPRELWSPAALGDWRDVNVLDVNGDHCDDLVTSANQVIYGSPAGFGRAEGLGVSVASWMGSFVGDFYGDGNLGLLGASILVTPHAGTQDLLTSIIDGNAQRIDIAYDGQAYNPRELAPVAVKEVPNEPEVVPCSWPALCEHRVGPVVSRTDVLGGTRTGAQFGDFLRRSTDTYTYVRARHGVQGRGGLGFHSRSIAHSDGGGNFVAKTDLTYDNFTSKQNNFGGIYFPLAGRITRSDEVTAAAKSELEDRSAALRSSVSYSWREQSSASGRPMVYLEQRDSENADNDATLLNGPEEIFAGTENFRLIRTREKFVEDDYGNVTHSEAREQWTKDTLSDVYNSYHVVDSTYDRSSARLNAWLIGAPLRRVETDSYRESTVTKLTDYSADAFGNLTQISEDIDDCSVGRVTTIIPNGFGSVSDVQTSRPAQCNDSEAPRSVHFDFDDRQMFPVRVTNALGQMSQVRYDGLVGGLLSAVDSNGLATQYAYDAFGRLLDVTSPSGASKRRYQSVAPPTGAVFDVRSVVRVIEDSSTGAHSERDLDAFGRVVRVASTGLNGKTVQSETAYNLAGFPNRATRPHLPNDTSQGEVDYFYDARQRLSSIKAADGSITRYGYASASNCRNDVCPVPPPHPPTTQNVPDDELVLREFNVRGVFSPRDSGLSLTYLDHRNQPVRVVDASGIPASYRYGAFGSVLGIIEPEGALTSVQYDKRQRPTWVSDPDKGVESYTYTPFDEVESITRPDEIPYSRVFRRDALGRVTGIADSVDGDSRFCFETACDDAVSSPASLALKNQIGRLVESISPSKIRTRYEFELPTITNGAMTGNNRGFLKATYRTIPKALTGAAVDEEFVTRYSYNQKNLLSQVQYPSSAGTDFAIGYSYDGVGNLESISDANASPQDPQGTYWSLAADYQGYAPAVERLGDGTLTSSQYESLTGRLKRLQTSATSPTQPPNPLLDLGFTYYDDGLRKTTTRQVPGAGEIRSEFYTYDTLGRLTNRATTIETPTSGVSLSETSDYSFSGNILSRTGPGAYRYDPDHQHRLAHASGVDLLYFTNGDVKTRSGDGVVGGEQNFEYTGFHLPKRVVIGASTNANEVRFEYDADQQRTIKTSSLGQRVYATAGYERFTPTESGPHAFAGETREHIYKVPTPGGLIVQVVRGESGGQLVGQSTLYIHPDEQGSPALIRDTNGVTHAAPVWNTSGAADNEATWASTTDPLARTVRTTYTGHEYDEELGLTNMRGRIFDQSVGRFLQPDPFTQAPYNTQGLNRYSYAFNSPLNLIDPSGFAVEPYCLPGCPGCGAPPVKSVGSGSGADQRHSPSSSDSRSQAAPGSGDSHGPADNASNSGGHDATGGDSNRGRPDNTGGPSDRNAGSAQEQGGKERTGDFSPGAPQRQAATGSSTNKGGYSYYDPWYQQPSYWQDAQEQVNRLAISIEIAIATIGLGEVALPAISNALTPAAAAALNNAPAEEEAARDAASFATKEAARKALEGPLGAAANRFFRDAAKNAQDFHITDLAEGGKRFDFFSPARNAGYGKLYVQEVDAAGAIVREFKNTLGPDGLIETKWVHGGP